VSPHGTRTDEFAGRLRHEEHAHLCRPGRAAGPPRARCKWTPRHQESRRTTPAPRQIASSCSAGSQGKPMPARATLLRRVSIRSTAPRRCPAYCSESRRRLSFCWISKQRTRCRSVGIWDAGRYVHAGFVTVEDRKRQIAVR
jgi:hypothetical protein